MQNQDSKTSIYTCQSAVFAVKRADFEKQV